ncbi:MAG: HAD family hydrolase [Nakamurella sp.]
MTLPAELDVVFIDVGGPIYHDETFVDAVTLALDDICADRGEGPVERAQVKAVYDRIRVAQNGSFRSALAIEVLGDSSLRSELHARTERYWRHPVGSLYADVLPFLQSLRGRVQVGILANQEASVIDALRRDGLADLIDIWGVSAVVGHEKPSRELFDWCLEQAATTAERAVHIGNRLDNDVRPAAALGLGTVWVLRGDAPDDPTDEQRSEPDLTVTELVGLGDVLLAGRSS